MKSATGSACAPQIELISEPRRIQRTKKAPETCRLGYFCQFCSRQTEPLHRIKSAALFRQAHFLCLKGCAPMTTRSTTPFGRRSMPLGLIVTNRDERLCRQQVCGDARASSMGVSVQDHIPTGNHYICDRDLTVIRHPLLTFHPDTRSRPCGKFSRLILVCAVRRLQSAVAPTTGGK